MEERLFRAAYRLHQGFLLCGAGAGSSPRTKINRLYAAMNGRSSTVIPRRRFRRSTSSRSQCFAMIFSALLYIALRSPADVKPRRALLYLVFILERKRE